GAVSLQHINGRDRFAADLIGGRALDDRPVHTPRFAVFLDILETAIDNRINRIKLLLDTFRRRPAAAPVTAFATIPATIHLAAATRGTALASAALTAFGAHGLAAGFCRGPRFSPLL